MNGAATRLEDSRVWHDVEHSSYSADLSAYRALAEIHGNPVVDLGAGTGRTSIDLAGRGHHVIAVEVDADLGAAVGEAADARNLRIDTVIADARSFELSECVPLIIAPMQFMHILGGEGGRGRMLDSVRDALSDEGVFATSILSDGLPIGVWQPEPVPDVREIDGWVYSSLATAIDVRESSIVLSRLRQIVSPTGSLEEAIDEMTLDRFSPADIEREAIAAGLEVTGMQALPHSAEHEDSLVVSMRKRRAV